MILPMHKALILIACKSSVEYVMRLPSRSKGGCERWINHRNLVQRPSPRFMTRGERETAEKMSEVL